MFEAMNFGAFKTGYGNQQNRETSAFALDLRPGNLLRDRVSGVEAVCNIPGDRWGVVNGVLTRIPAYKPSIVDGGLRVCPAFTQYALSSEDISSIYWNRIGLLSITTLTYQGMSISNIIEDTTNSNHQFSQSIGAISDNSTIGYCFICKPISGKTKISIRALKKDNTISVFILNMDTAIFTTIPAGGIANVSKLPDGYLKIFLSLNALSGAINPLFNIRFLNESSLDSYVGNGLSGILFGQPSIINFGVAGVPFIPPYVPTTAATVSVVAETATATTGTSFDLDDPKLARLKSILRGVAVGTEISNPATVTTQVIDANTYSSVVGDVYRIFTNNNTYINIKWPVVLTAGKTYEISAIQTATPIGSIKEDSTGIAIPLNGAPIRFTAIGTELRIARNPVGVIDCSFTLSVKEVQAEGHVEITLNSAINSSWLPTVATTDYGICSINTLFNFICARKYTDGRFNFNLTDSTFTGTGVTYPIVPGQQIKIIADFGNINGVQKQRITVNGVKSAIAAFCGTYGTGDFKIGYGNLIDLGRMSRFEVRNRPEW